METDEAQVTGAPCPPPDTPVDVQEEKVQEGKCVIDLSSRMNTFYNPAQEINRDVSVLGIHTYLSTTPSGKNGKPESVTILEAMAASGIRSIRYAKEIPGVTKVIANDILQKSVELIQHNSLQNEVTSIVEPNLSDACALMYSQQNTHFVVDIDPYGTPVPFLDSAIKCVKNGGLLLVTATDLAILAGNTPETCFAKYGSMSLKSEACHEIALRIVINTVQSLANKQGRYVVPLLSLKIDFYVRLFFRVLKGPEMCKKSVSLTSMVFQCTACRSLSFQPIGIQKPDGKYGFALLNANSGLCCHCQSKQHIGGPIWTGPIHDKQFVSSMLTNLKSDYSHLGTRCRIEGMLTLVMEELDTPLYYNPTKFCSFLRAVPISMLKLRSALMNLGYEVSNSHTGPTVLKTNAPNEVLWDVFREWTLKNSQDSKSESKLQEPAVVLLKAKLQENWTKGIDFSIRADANPPSREAGILRYQPNLGFGPGVKGTFAVPTANQKAEQKAHEQNRKRKHPEAS